MNKKIALLSQNKTYCTSNLGCIQINLKLKQSNILCSELEKLFPLEGEYFKVLKFDLKGDI